MTIAAAEFVAPSGSKSLADLAKTIRAEHALVCEAGLTMIDRAIRAGDALRAAKPLVPHGEWQAWLDDEFPEISRWSVSRYMRVSQYQERIRDLQPSTMIQALRLVAGEAPTPKYNEEIRQQARAFRDQGMTYQGIADALGVSKGSIERWLNPSALARQRAYQKTRSRAARRLMQEEQRRAVVQKVGGPIAHAYANTRKALEALQQAFDGELDSETRSAVRDAMGRLHSAEDFIVKASKLS